ncbi:MAG: GDSL-type esterase/lipase family protein, partial [Candidatus Omnitrophica bacterium]|nr:GDSL-type esterase/lipase family protein [Candidatus Omnitrophota bacterium]
ETTRDALKRIEKDVLEQDPRLVIVEFCANDFLKSVPKQETFDNLDKIISLIQAKGAMAVFAYVRSGYLEDEYVDGLKRLARKKRALFIPNIMGGILLNPELISSDQVHPNDQGYRLIAERIYTAIRPLLGK